MEMRLLWSSNCCQKLADALVAEIVAAGGGCGGRAHAVPSAAADMAGEPSAGASAADAVAADAAAGTEIVGAHLAGDEVIGVAAMAVNGLVSHEG